MNLFPRIFLFFFAISFSKISAQSIDVKWSEQFIYDNKLDGFFDEFIGSNNSIVYAKFSNYALKRKDTDKKIKLIAFDKSTMKKVFETKIKGYEDKESKDFNYLKSVVLANRVCVFWTKDSKKITEVFVQLFDSKFTRLSGIKKIFDLKKGNRGDDTDRLAVAFNNERKDKLVIIREFNVSEGKNISIDYKVFNTDLSLFAENQIGLPVKLNKYVRQGGARRFEKHILTYEFGEDDKLYIQDIIRMTKEERKTLEKGQTSTYPHLLQLNLVNGTYKEYNVRFPKKNTFRSSFLSTKSGLKIYGFFSDLEKDVKGNDSHGLFCISLDKDFGVAKEKFSYFDKKFLDELFLADKENQKKGSWYQSEKAKASDEESLDDNYVIEQVVKEGDDIVLFCSIMNNYSNTSCNTVNGVTNCYTSYYCRKSNVTAFRMNPAGEIVWARNMDRSRTYGGWDIYDLSVMKKNDAYYVIYGSAFQLNATNKSRRSRKSGKQMDDRLEYAVFQASNGSFKKAEYQINSVNAKKEDRKYISTTNIHVFDNLMYSSWSKIKYKPATFVSCLIPPVFYFLQFNGDTRTGRGRVATIMPLN